MKLNHIKKLDALWARLVKLNAKYKCEYCLEEKRQFKGGPGIWLEAAHVIGRTHRPTRWLPDNGVALCSGCHAAYDQHLPKEHEIRNNLIGKERYQRLRSTTEPKAIDQVYEIELKKLSQFNDVAKRVKTVSSERKEK